jgi:hypothetical protein
MALMGQTSPACGKNHLAWGSAVVTEPASHLWGSAESWVWVWIPPRRRIRRSLLKADTPNPDRIVVGLENIQLRLNIGDKKSAQYSIRLRGLD